MLALKHSVVCVHVAVKHVGRSIFFDEVVEDVKTLVGRSSRSPYPLAGACVIRMSMPPAKSAEVFSFIARRLISFSV